MIMLGCFSISSYAQSNLVKGSHYLNLNYGFSKYSLPKYASFNYGHCFNEKMIYRIGVGFENGKVVSTKFNNMYLNVDYMYNLFSIKSKLYCNAGIGGFCGMEFIKSDLQERKEFSLVYGGKLNLELDYLIDTKWSVKGEFSEWYVGNSLLGNWIYTGTVGISYVLN